MLLQDLMVAASKHNSLLRTSCCCVLTILLLMSSVDCTKIAINAPWGIIEGLAKMSNTGFSYLSFEGIPYAQPPVGDLRFAKPVPSVGSRTEVYKAHSIKPPCHAFFYPGPSSEDCLHLDMYIPVAATFPLSVMVFLHGGAFIFFSDQNNFLDLMQKGDVIVVFPRYRLGPFGFLSTGDGELKGNYGLWDQNLALQWVKDNVAAFGGNPNSITIFGNSAGSASVGYQALALQSKDLFQRAILSSGAPTATWALERNPMPHAFKLAEKLYCGSRDHFGGFVPRRLLVDCLRSKNASEIMAKSMEMYLSRPVASQVGDFMFVPVVDGEFVIAEPRLLLENQNFLKKLGTADKDFIVGIVQNEGTLISLNPSIPQPPHFFNFFNSDLIPMLLSQRFGMSYPSSVHDLVYTTYSGAISPALLQISMVIDAFVDPAFIIPAIETAQAFSSAQIVFGGKGKSFFYLFDYCPSFNPVFCMSHSMDVIFLFNRDKLIANPVDLQMSTSFINLLSSFAKTSQPTAPNVAQPWAQYRAETRYKVLRIAPNATLHENILLDRQEMWMNVIRSKIAEFHVLT